MGALLGFTGLETVLLRAAMAAWLISSDDHSFFEVMLAADPFMPQGFGMRLGMDDLGQMWPRGALIHTTDGRSFDASDLWGALGQRLTTPEGRRLVGRMDAEAQDYLRVLTGGASSSDVALVPSRTTLVGEGRTGLRGTHAASPGEDGPSPRGHTRRSARTH